MPKIQIDPESKLTGVFVAEGDKMVRGEGREVPAGHPALSMMGILVEDDPVEEKPIEKPAVKKVAKKKAAKKK